MRSLRDPANVRIPFHIHIMIRGPGSRVPPDSTVPVPGPKVRATGIRGPGSRDQPDSTVPALSSRDRVVLSRSPTREGTVRVRGPVPGRGTTVPAALRHRRPRAPAHIPTAIGPRQGQEGRNRPLGIPRIPHRRRTKTSVWVCPRMTPRPSRRSVFRRRAIPHTLLHTAVRHRSPVRSPLPTSNPRRRAERPTGRLSKNSRCSIPTRSIRSSMI